MEREAFKLFIEVAELGSISRVAALRQTVQSNVSRQIAESSANAEAVSSSAQAAASN